MRQSKKESHFRYSLRVHTHTMYDENQLALYTAQKRQHIICIYLASAIWRISSELYIAI